MNIIIASRFTLGVVVTLLVTPVFALPPQATDRLSIVKNIPDTWRVLRWDPPGNEDGGPAEFRPADQLGEEWNESIKLRSFNNGPFKLIDFARGLTRLNHKEQCTYYTQSTPEADSRNGFDSISVIDMCGARRTTGMGDVTIYKVISYPGWIAVGERTIRLSAFDENSRPTASRLETLKQWAKGFYLCANDGSNRSCPTVR